MSCYGPYPTFLYFWTWLILNSTLAIDAWLLSFDMLVQDEPEATGSPAAAAASSQLGPRTGRRATVQSPQHASTPQTRPVRSRLATQTNAAGNLSCKGLYLTCCTVSCSHYASRLHTTCIRAFLVSCCPYDSTCTTALVAERSIGVTSLGTSSVSQCQF